MLQHVHEKASVALKAKTAGEEAAAVQIAQVWRKLEGNLFGVKLEWAAYGLKASHLFFLFNWYLISPSSSGQLQGDLDDARKQLASASSEAKTLALRLAAAEASRDASEQAHLTFAERSKSLQQQVEDLSESLERERGLWSQERMDIQVWT